VVMLWVMHLLTRRAFSVAFEWRRLAQLVLVMGSVAAAGDLLLPTVGLLGFLTRGAAFLLIPLLLRATRFAHAEELDQLRRAARRVGRTAVR
jgi:hypothetical protein